MPISFVVICVSCGKNGEKLDKLERKQSFLFPSAHKVLPSNCKLFQFNIQCRNRCKREDADESCVVFFFKVLVATKQQKIIHPIPETTRSGRPCVNTQTENNRLKVVIVFSNCKLLM